MEKNFIVTTSPFLKDHTTSTQSVMRDVCIALMPTLICAIYFFGMRAFIMVILSTISAVFFEALFQKISHQDITIRDYSAAVTGLLVGMNIPSSAPYWLPVFGSFLAIVLVKQLFGGLGQNFMNPALVARTILFISWASLMSARVEPLQGNFLLGLTQHSVDFISVATPLGHSVTNYSIWDLFIGKIPGMIGETSKLTLLMGGIYLIYKKVIDWKIPFFIIFTVFALFFIYTGKVYSADSGVHNALSQILSGGLFLGAFFMATDYVTCPLYTKGRIIMSVLCGVLIFVIRAFGNYPEGTSFAILFMNILTPIIDKYTYPKSFGEVAKNEK